MPSIHRPVAACLIAASSASAQEIVVPLGWDASEGSSRYSYPFSAIAPESQRFQQVYASSQFAALPGPRQIVAIRFRPDGPSTYPAWSNEVTLEVRLSVTPRGPDGLSNVFADNVGAGQTLVYSGPAVIATAQSGPAPGPLAFDVVLTLQTPFLYNPAAGNLLLDVVREGFSLVATRYLDAEHIPGDAISSVATPTTSTSAATFGSASTAGLITRFSFQGGPAGCYANCDSSTAPPILNVQDFTCFLQRYAAGDAYANCDQSTTVPVLNVQDFTCFLQRYAAGCP